MNTDAAGHGITIRDLVVRGGQINTRVQVKGSGPPLLFLHGLLGLHWGSYLNTLAEHFTVYALEYPGTTPGHSQVVYQIWDVLDLLLFYDDVVSELGIDRAVVVGESLGGMIALEYAAVFPGRVEKVVCAAPYGLWREELPIENYGRHAIEELPPVFSARPGDPEVQACFPFGKSGEEYVEAAVNLTWSLGVATKFLWPIPERGLARRVHRVAAPVHLIWGSADDMIPNAYAAEFAALLANSSHEVIDGVGHTVFLDAPDVAAKATLTFLGDVVGQQAVGTS